MKLKKKQEKKKKKKTLLFCLLKLKVSMYRCFSWKKLYIYNKKKLIKEINKNKYIYNLENKKKNVKTKFSYKK